MMHRLRTPPYPDKITTDTRTAAGAAGVKMDAASTPVCLETDTPMLSATDGEGLRLQRWTNITVLKKRC